MESTFLSITEFCLLKSEKPLSSFSHGCVIFFAQTEPTPFGAPFDSLSMTKPIFSKLGEDIDTSFVSNKSFKDFLNSLIFLISFENLRFGTLYSPERYANS